MDDWKHDPFTGLRLAEPRRRRVMGEPDWVDPRRTRGKIAHPYSYDAYYLWKSRARDMAGSGSDYSDRLAQGNSAKFTEACRMVPGKGFNQYTRAEASLFLTTYFGRPMRAVALIESCNVSSGHPCWVFQYKEARGRTCS